MEKDRKQSNEFMVFAAHELNILEEQAADKALYKKLKSSVLELCKTFSKECGGRVNGMKSKTMLRLFAKIASQMPLTPIEGKDSEWIAIMDEETGEKIEYYENVRCPQIIKTLDGKYYDTKAVVFSYDGAIWFKTKESEKEITFPYEVPVSPERVMLERPEENS